MNARLNLQLKRALLGAFFASIVCSQGSVGAATEVEPNDTKDTAQALEFTSPAIVSAMLGTGSGVLTDDIDIYYFDGKAGDVPVITLSTGGDWDAILYFYDSAGNLLDSNDDAYPPTEGSLCTVDWTVVCDPRIDLRPLDMDGRYYIAVGPAMRFMWTNFEVHPSFIAPQPGGAYELMVQGVTVPDTGGDETGDSGGGNDGMMEVMITSLQSDDDEPGLGTYKGKKAIPVAIHSAMPEFNAMENVDQKSLTFGATGDEKSLLKCKKKGKKVKVDGVKDHDRDLVCYFRPDVAGIAVGDMSAVLKGKTKDGKEFAGSGILRVVELPTVETVNWYKRHDLDSTKVKPKKVKKEKTIKKAK